jgi:hypothetical protein
MMSPFKLIRRIVKILVFGATINSSAFSAELSPQVMGGGGGMLNINTFSGAYVPSSSTTAGFHTALDGRLNQKWSLALRTVSSVNQTLSGVSAGLTYHLNQHRNISTVDANGLMQVQISKVPVWTARAGLGLGRWSYSQILKQNNPLIAARLRDVPVKASIYGIQIRASVSRSFGQSWSVDGEYGFIYAAASGLSLIVHSATVGPSYWF